MNKLLPILLIFFIIYIFHPWFNPLLSLSSGDWPYLYIENVKEFSFLPSNITWLTPYHQITAKIFVEYLSIDWKIFEKLFWYWPFIILSLYSSWHLSKNFFDNKNYRILVSFIFLTNTYSLMLTGGGQMGVALAYSLSPLVLSFYIRLIKNTAIEGGNLKLSVIVGFMLVIQGVFDIRIAYVTLLGVMIFYLLFFIIFNLKSRTLKRTIISSIFYVFIVPFSIALIFHFYWILPRFFSTNNTLLGFDSSYISLDAVKFFSFASFSQSLSLLHPNWPENIFGKIYFTKPEFVLLPIIAFSSLFFLNFSAKDNAEKKNKKITILSFILMGLIGAFFSKGSNPPFGEIYYWMFNHIPGFIMFRDPTKWYLLIALSYSIIIPFTLSKFADKLSISKITMFKKLSYLILVIFLLIWSFCIKEAILGKLNGTFKPNQIPKEYFKFKEYIQSKPTYSATLWVPSIQRYGFNSKLYPAIDVSIFQNSGTKSLSEHLNDPKIKKMILGKGVRYVIIPYDSQKEIFIYDRKYSFQEYEKVINEIRKISWLKYDKHFGELFVFKVSIE